MNAIKKLLSASFTLAALIIPSSLPAQGTAFTYDGRLSDGSNPANGIYDLRFSIYDALVVGTQQGPTLTNAATAVSNGLFAVTLDFGNRFPGADRWIEIAVRPNGGGAFSTLAPRQKISATPYAVQSENANTAATAGSVAAGNVTGTMNLAQLPATLLTNGASGVNISGTFSGNGAALTGLNGANLLAGSVGSAQLAAGTLVAPVSAAGNTVNAVANTSYVVTNSSAANIFLPSNASIGDVIQITGQGASSWTALGLGDWSQASAPGASWDSVASSSDGRHLAAAVYGGSIYTSTNFGATWAPTSAPGAAWNALASSSDGSHLVAGVFNGRIYTSTNFGATWTQTSAPVSDWRCVASSADGSRLVAGAVSSSLYVSTDYGATWTPYSPNGTTQIWVGLAASSDGSHLVAATDDGPIFTSTNFGVNWTQQPFLSGIGNWWSVASSADGSRLIAGASHRLYTSTNFGVNWTLQTGAPTNTNWRYVASSSDGNRLAAVAAGGGLYTSADFGASWTLQTAVPTNGFWNSVASSADGSRLVAAVNGGGIYLYQAAAISSGTAGTSATLQYLGNGQWATVTLAPSSLPPNAVTNGASGINLSGTFSGNGAGITNVDIRKLQQRLGYVTAWGDNSNGQTNVPADLTNVVAIAGGDLHDLALKSDGTVVGWGNNTFGQTTIPAGLTTVVAIEAGGNHSLALKGDGTIAAWGRNNAGQTTIPVGLSNVVSVAAGYLHSLALKSDGTVVAWGASSSEPGDNQGQTNVPAGLNNVVAIAAGDTYSLALKGDGTVVAWGSNLAGQTNIPVGLNNVMAITSGGSHALALKSNGTIVAWGNNANGQTNVPVGLNSVVAVAAGQSHSLALKSDGTIVAWGNNTLGQTNVPSGLNNAAIAAGGNQSLVLQQSFVPAQLALLTENNNFQGTITSAGFSGNGSGLSNLNAANLTGTIASNNIAADTIGSAHITDGAIVNADVSSSAAIAYSKLNLANSIMNADISGSAAIADTKLATISAAGKVANAATTASSANTANAIVARDASGNFTAGTVTATTFSGSGASLTALSASQLTSGTVADARLSANVSLLGSTIESAEITDGTIVNADINASAAIADTKLATISTAGKVANAATTATSANTANAIVARDASGNFTAGTVTATTFSGSGASLTSLNASQLTSGNVADARLSANVAMLAANPQTFTGSNNFASTIRVGTRPLADGQTVQMRVVGDLGGGWKGSGAFGHSNATVILGETSSTATVGAHNANLSAWANLALNPGGGNVGIGTFAPVNRLSVNGDANFTGDVGIGTTNPLAPLHVSTTANAASLIQSSATTGTWAGIVNTAGGETWQFVSTGSGNAEGAGKLLMGWDKNLGALTGVAMTLVDNGRVGIGTVNPLNPLSVAGNADVSGNLGVGTGSPTARLSVNGAANNTTGAWGIFSDRRLKKHVEPMAAGSLDRMLKLEGVTYEYTQPELHEGYDGIYRGWIAQQVEEVFPEWVSEAPNGMKMVTPVGFDALAVEALRELRTEKNEQVSRLEAENSELKARLEKLEALVSKSLKGGAK